MDTHNGHLSTMVGITSLKSLVLAVHVSNGQLDCSITSVYDTTLETSDSVSIVLHWYLGGRVTSVHRRLVVLVSNGYLIW